MGYMRHHAIVVTSWSEEAVKAGHAKAVALGCTVSEIVDSKMNGYTSFLIAPDGSKEGWGESNDGDGRRMAWIAWARTTLYEDGSGPLDWVEVRFGGDDDSAEVTSHADEDAEGGSR